MENLAVARLSDKFRPVQTASYGDDSGAMAMFDDEFVKNEFKSEMEGRAVYDHYYMVELQWPGDKSKTFKYRFPITQTKNEYIERFPKQWEAFKNSMEQVPDGTPIEMWPPLDKRRVLELKASRIHTVEQIAALTDANGPSAIGLEWCKIRDQAIAFINPAQSLVQVSRLTRENEDMKAQLEALKQQVSQMGNANITPMIKRRGRKPKSESTEAA